MLSFSEVPPRAGSKETRYQFNSEIQSKLKSFADYLHEQGNAPGTIRQKSNYAGHFLTWLQSQYLSPEQTRYNDLLHFIDHCKLEADSTRHINTRLRSIRHYYDYLKTQNPHITNPASGLHLKGTRSTIISGITDFAHLETLYHDFPAHDSRTQRNRTMLGLLVYQALTTEELHRLEPSHLKLKEGKIHIPGNRRRNSRTLELKPFQILELHEYLTETRPTILKEIEEPRPARKPDTIHKTKIENQLFISINGSENIKNSLLHMFKDIYRINPALTSAKSIRQSTITHWLKTHNLRQVQYMAGHKYVSSTERYQVNNLESLQNKLEKCHPLNKQP